MSEVVITSSTDSQAAVDAAAELVPGDRLIEQPAESPEPDAKGVRTDSGEEGHVTVVHRSESGDVSSTTDSQQVVDEVSLDKAEDREEDKQEYLGKTRRKLLRQVTRLSARLEAYERGAARTPTVSDNGSAPPEQVAGAPQLTPEQRAQLEAQYQFELEQLKGQLTYPYRLKEAKTRLPDFEEVIGNSKTVLPKAVLHALVTVPDGPDVAYFLEKNPAYVEDIMQAFHRGDGGQIANTLDYVSNGLQRGVLHNSPQQQGTRERTRTAPPAPISPLGGGHAGPSSKDPNSMTYAEFRAWRDNGGGGGGRRR